MNPVTDRVYVVNSYADTVSVIDGAGHVVVATVAVGARPQAVAIDPAAGKAYVANQATDSVTVVDGATNATSTVAAGGSPRAVAVDVATGKAYVTNETGCTVTTIDPQPEQAVPLTTAITPLTGDVTSDPTPTFGFTATSLFSPIAPPVQQVYYRVDSRRGPWLKASPAGAAATGTLPALTPGAHVLFAYAVDGGEATAANTGFSSSPLVGQVAAYAFTYVPPFSATTVTAPTATSSWPSGSTETVSWRLDWPAAGGEFRVALINQSTGTWYVNTSVPAEEGRTGYSAAVIAAVPAGSYKAAVYWRPTPGGGNWTVTKKSAAFTVALINITVPGASTV